MQKQDDKKLTDKLFTSASQSGAVSVDEARARSANDRAFRGTGYTTGGSSFFQIFFFFDCYAPLISLLFLTSDVPLQFASLPLFRW